MSEGGGAEKGEGKKLGSVQKKRRRKDDSGTGRVARVFDGACCGKGMTQTV